MKAVKTCLNLVLALVLVMVWTAAFASEPKVFDEEIRALDELQKQGEPGQLININQADAKQLQLLEGIGPDEARAIVDYRAQQGPFEKIPDLLRVEGIAPDTLAKIRKGITVE